MMLKCSMRILVICALLSSAAVVACAQASQSVAEQANIALLKQSWRKFRHDISFRGFPPNPNNPFDVARPHIPDIITEYVYNVRVRNTGAQTIKIIGWDYVFVDPTNGTEVGRHHFQNEVRIRPNKQSALEGYTPSPPSKIVTVSALQHNAKNPFAERVEITCIAYKDGSVWRASMSDETACQPQRRRMR